MSGSKPVWDEVGHPLSGIVGKSFNGAAHGFLIASTFSYFLKVDNTILSLPGGPALRTSPWASFARSSYAEGLLGAKLVGAWTCCLYYSSFHGCCRRSCLGATVTCQNGDVIFLWTSTTAFPYRGVSVLQ